MKRSRSKALREIVGIARRPWRRGQMVCGNCARSRAAKRCRRHARLSFAKHCFRRRKFSNRGRTPAPNGMRPRSTPPRWRLGSSLKPRTNTRGQLLAGSDRVRGRQDRRHPRSPKPKTACISADRFRLPGGV